MQRLKRYFIAGFVAVIPVVLTIYVIIFIFRFADNILGKYLNSYLKDLFGFYIPGLSIVIFFLLIFIFGFLATTLFSTRMRHRIERWFMNLPLVKNIYPPFKQIILFISAQKEFGFKKVVLVQYPSSGIWSIGFLTHENFKKITDVCNKEMASVFIPTSPGPLTGFLIFIPKEELKFLNISVSEALRIIISGGVFQHGDGIP